MFGFLFGLFLFLLFLLPLGIGRGHFFITFRSDCINQQGIKLNPVSIRMRQAPLPSPLPPLPTWKKEKVGEVKKKNQKPKKGMGKGVMRLELNTLVLCNIGCIL